MKTIMNRFSNLWHNLVGGCHREGHLWRGWLKLVYPLLSLAALAWFLFRVIPKPSRASYPCQRAAFPLASSFVLWLVGIQSGVIAWMRLKKYSRSLLPILIVLGLGGLTWAATGPVKGILPVPNASPSVAAAWTPSDPPNSPIGVARGIFPGRVTWMRDTNATPWNGSTGNWWQPGNINQPALNRMVSRSLRGLTGADNDEAAWNSIFHYFNRTHGRGDVGYQTGEAIAVKINLNNCYGGYSDADNNIDASPQGVLALLDQLVNHAGVPQNMITIYDATRAIPDRIYTPDHAAFPAVHWVDGQGLNGREAPNWVTGAISYSVPSLAQCGTRLPACVVNATYLINFALLKGHEIAGVTLCGKNHFGSIENPGGDHGNYVSQRDFPMGHYAAWVDMMGCPNLGGKTMLNILDGLYGDRTNVGDVNAGFCSWTNLFGGQWCASYFMSLDPVAIDSVGLDFLRSEFGNMLGYSGASWSTPGASTNADNYLHEAALANNPPSGTPYKPNGVALGSLGVHEHWNNAVAKQYSRNLSPTGTGIELVTLQNSPAMTATLLAPTNGDWFLPGTNLVLLASVTTNLSRLDRVEFYANATLIGVCSNNLSPTLTWSNAPPGQWTFTAVAYDSDNYSITSAVANVTIAYNQIAVALTNPPAGAMFVQGSNILLQASASASAAPIQRVDFYRSGIFIGASSSAPYSFQWPNVPVGIWSLAAVATDTGNYSVTLSVVSVTVRPAGLAVAGTLYVDLRASDASAAAATWTNFGTLGNFTRVGAPAQVLNVAGTGIPGVQFNGVSDAFVGPGSVADIDGGSSRSIEVWALNPDIANEETILEIGHRGTVGSNLAFNYGTNLTWGAAAQWGAYDVGWNNVANIPAAGAWHHLVYTYDGATTCKIYVDGALRITQTLPGVLTTFAGEPILLGAQRDVVASGPPAEFWYSGYVNSIRVHGGVLNASDVAANYAYGPAQPSGPPVITAQPQNISALEGGSATLAVSVQGGNPISFQWYRNGAACVAATNSTFALTNIAWCDDGAAYLVVASNFWNGAACVVTSSIAKLTVMVPGDALQHRYSFTSNANDSVGTAHGTLQGAATISGGKVSLDGTSGTYVNLPGGLIAGYRAVTFEFWASFGVNANWPRLFDQGSTNGNYGQYDLYFCPHSGNGDYRLTIMDPQPTERVVSLTGNLDNQANLHVACVLDPATGFMGFYTNGILAVSRTDLASLGSVATNLFFLGRSLYASDPWLNGSIDEFRIYNAALNARQVWQSYTNGPDATPVPAVHVVTPPNSRTNYVGTAASFNVVPNACGAVAAQWFHGPAPIANATNLSLMLTNVQPEAAGGYAVALANAANAVTSPPAALAVLPLPNLQPLVVSASRRLTLTWPDGTGELALFETTNLMTPGSWIPSTNETALSNGLRIAPISITDDAGRFYRLQMP